MTSIKVSRGGGLRSALDSEIVTRAMNRSPSTMTIDDTSIINDDVIDVSNDSNRIHLFFYNIQKISVIFTIHSSIL